MRPASALLAGLGTWNSALGTLIAAEGQLPAFDAAAGAFVDHRDLLRLALVDGRRLRAADHRDAPRAAELADAVGFQHPDEAVDLVLVAHHLEDERVGRDVDDVGPEDVRD